MIEMRTLEVVFWSGKTTIPDIYIIRSPGTRLYEFPTKSSLQRLQNLIDSSGKRVFVELSHNSISLDFPKERM